MNQYPKPGRGLSLYRFLPWPGGISGDPEIFSFKTTALRKGYWVFGERRGKSSRARILLLYLAGS
jgi:hypothetical protein